MFSFPFPRHFHQASHVGVKYIPKYWEQHCGAVGSLGPEAEGGWGEAAVREGELKGGTGVGNLEKKRLMM